MNRLTSTFPGLRKAIRLKVGDKKKKREKERKREREKKKKREREKVGGCKERVSFLRDKTVLCYTCHTGTQKGQSKGQQGRGGKKRSYKDLASDLRVNFQCDLPR